MIGQKKWLQIYRSNIKFSQLDDEEDLSNH